jgi:hypothetical protein
LFFSRASIIVFIHFSFTFLFFSTMKKQIPRGLPPLLLLVLLLLGLAGCFKQTDPPDPPIPPTNTYPTTPPTDLPPATQTGAGTLGCKINGRVWTFWIPPIALTDEQDAVVTESAESGIAGIEARLWSADTFDGPYRIYHDMAMYFFNPNLEERTITKAVAGTLTADGFSFGLYVGNQYKVYHPDTSTSAINNWLVIDKLDTENNIISGRFAATVYIGNNYVITDRSDSLVISDGRFDFKYRQE